MKRQHRCRMCDAEDLAELLTLDGLPVSHDLRRSVNDPDPRFNLTFETCGNCGLMQIVNTVPAEILYRATDTYTTGFHRPRHIEELLISTIAHQDPGRAIDIGCNDGALMSAMGKAGYAPVVGIEPNVAAADLAEKAGFRVYRDFLTDALADRIVAENGRFETAYLRHVGEHVEDLTGFFAAIRALLSDDGVLVMELPQVEPGLLRGNPAVLWEEHVNYFSEPLAEYLLKRFGFATLERRHYAFGGGAIAFIARKAALPAIPPVPPNPDLSLRLAVEFKSDFTVYRDHLSALVSKARAAGYRIVMYGAAPRSCVVAAACGISSAIDIVIDDRPDIQGRLMPGTIRPILGFDQARAALNESQVLCLLGVGSENEHKVMRKMEAGLHQPLTGVSLFPPRDTLVSIAAAAATIQKSQV